MAFVFFLKSLNITNLERGDLKINDFLIGSLASSSAVSLLIALCAVSLLGLFCNEVNSEGQQ
jgi:hypothetical protein